MFTRAPGQAGLDAVKASFRRPSDRSRRTLIFCCEAGTYADRLITGLSCEQTAPVSSDLPAFRYHPDPLASGSFRESAESCACCNRATGWIYTASFYTAQEVSGRFCPWCVADGSAAERFAGEFIDSCGLDGVSEETVHEVTRRTPGFHAWQDPHWLVHCHEAAAFIGEVGYSELVAHPEALGQLRQDLRLGGGWHDAAQLEQFLTHLGEGATAMLFRCTICGSHLAYADAS